MSRFRGLLRPSLTAIAVLSVAGLTLSATTPTWADAMTSITYPETQRGPLVEDKFGEKIADPYRWLENDVRNDKQVAAWVESQNAATRAHLDTLPQHDWFAQRIRTLIDYERFGLPVKAAGQYFYTRNSGLQNQAQLFVRDGLKGEPRLLLDPNSWANDGATALDSWEPSQDGKHLLYSVQDGGSDWRVLRVLDVATGKPLADEIKWAKFTGLAWAGDRGFLYSRFPEPEQGTAFQGRNYNHAVYFHSLGTPQSEDQLVLSTPDEPELSHSATVTPDGRYVVISSTSGTDARVQVRYVDLQRRTRDGWNPRMLVAERKHDWKLVGSTGTKLWFVTNQDAPRYKLVVTDLAAAEPKFTQVVAERPELLERATIVGNQLVLNYLKDAASSAEIVTMEGKKVRTLALAGLGTAAGFEGKPGDPETFYAYSSFNQPTAIYRMDVATGKSEPFAKPAVKFDPDKYLVEQRFYTSKDGTKVPMFVVRNKAMAAAGKAQPTLLYGYGGFEISLTPGYSAARMAWLEAGGAFAMANLRGGGEYGKEWHDAGRLANKQNVFDDFIAAGEYLIAQGITPKNGLSVQGGSNGGLLVGAVVNQRPDLFAAANAAVGVMDMLRFDQFTAGRYWVDDYGYPEKEADFRVLRKYSPYHNIRSGVDYPAVLVTTADTDDRVVPGHSFKYTAALQHAKTGDKPHLIRIETRAGHGSGKPTDKVIEEGADVLSFLAHWSGLQTTAQ